MKPGVSQRICLGLAMVHLQSLEWQHGNTEEAKPLLQDDIKNAESNNGSPFNTT
jgi:hypothetical protein